MPVQQPGTYDLDRIPGFEGGYAEYHMPGWRVTGITENAAIPFGLMVQFDNTGTENRSIKLMDTADGPGVEPMIGVSMRSKIDASPVGASGSLCGVRQNCVINVLKFGIIMVRVENDVTQQTDVGVRFQGVSALGGDYTTGTFGDIAGPGGADMNQLFGRARYLHPAAAGELVKLSMVSL